MQKYKVQITKSYVIDVLERDEEQATIIAKIKLNELEALDQQHYHEDRDPEVTVYDVTNTDDPFNP